MNAETFRAACQLLWGDHDQWGAVRATEFLGVSARNVYYWAAGSKPVPPGIALELGREIHRRLLDPSDTTPALEAIRLAQSSERNQAA